MIPRQRKEAKDNDSCNSRSDSGTEFTAPRFKQLFGAQEASFDQQVQDFLLPSGKKKNNRRPDVVEARGALDDNSAMRT